jgi:3D (Asp-Asp-Asp) domain-containing protein
VRRRVLALAAAGLVPAAPAQAKPDVRAANATSYCLGGRMADGTFTRPRSAAHNGLRLGTRIRLVGHPAGPRGMRRYVVRDRIGHGSQLDLWTGSCGTALRWGRRTVRFRLGWAR